MSNKFEEDIAQSIRNSVLAEIKKTAFLNLQYSERKHIPSHILDDLWGSIKWDEVLEEIRPMVQTRICNSIVASMETELKTDIKSLLSVDGVRQKLRIEVYPKLMKVLEGENK